MLSWGRGKNGQLKSQSSIMPEDYEEFILLTLRTRNSKKPLGMLERKGKHQWLPLCLARQARRAGMERPIAKLMISNQNLRVSWKPANPHDCVWKNLYRIIMRTILQEERGQFTTTLQFGPQIYSYASSYENSSSKKAAVDKEGKLEKNCGLGPDKVISKSEVIDEARTKGAKVHFASLMDICHLKNAELETKHQKYKGQVVLRGDIVKDDSGSYAVLTEQGFSASQMTAAKVVDIISRLPGCAGQAADTVSAYTQVKMEDAPKLLKISKLECPDTWIRLPRHKWPKSWSSQCGRPSHSSWTKSVRSSFSRTVMGKAIWESLVDWITVGSRFPIENAHSYTVKKDYSYLCMWITSNWLERNKILIRCGKY